MHLSLFNVLLPLILLLLLRLLLVALLPKPVSTAACMESESLAALFEFQVIDIIFIQDTFTAFRMTKVLLTNITSLVIRALHTQTYGIEILGLVLTLQNINALIEVAVHKLLLAFLLRHR